MIKEAIGTGKTPEEALENAKAALNAPFEADVKFETLELPTKKTFGIFGKERPAKVRAFYEMPDPKPEKAAEPVAAKPQAQHNKPSKPQQNKPAKQERKQETPAAKTEKKILNSADFAKTEEYIRSILKGLGIDECKIVFAQEDDGLSIDLDCGDGYGVVIGRRGETLDAIQYLVRLFMNKGNDNYKRVSINIGNYREKREGTLQELAKRNAAKVLKYGRNVVLDPMNPYERRIIHTAIQEIEGVESHSVGSDSERKVVITLTDGFKPTHADNRGYNNRGGKGGNNRGYNNRGGRGGDRDRNRQQQPAAPQRAPRSDIGSASRYGKIEPKNKPAQDSEE